MSLPSLIIPSLLFTCVAFIYSTVGLGGGSSYMALLMAFAFPYQWAPSIALICNLVVVSGGTYHFAKNGYFRWNLLWPWILASIPFSYLGGRIPLSKATFSLILGAVLVVVGFRMIFTTALSKAHSKRFTKEENATEKSIEKIPLLLALPIGALLGLLSGLVGIGGGIFLSPVLYFFGWGQGKEIAATAASFIWLNAMAGLVGQGQKLGHSIFASLSIILSLTPLLLAVLIGGQLGSRMGSQKLRATTLEKITGILLIPVGMKLLYDGWPA